MELHENKEITQLKNHLLTLEKITEAVHKSGSLKEVIENVVSSMESYIENADNISFYLREHERAVLKSYRGYDEKYVNSAGSIPYPKGFTWKALEEEKTIYCNDTSNDPVIGQAGKRFGTKSYVSLPLKIGSKAVGVININSKEENAFDSDDLRLLELAKKQVEIALERAENLEKYVEEKKISQSYLDTAEIITVGLDLNQNVIVINRKGCEILDRNENDIVGKNWFENFIPHGDRQRLKSVYDDLISEKIANAEFFTNNVLTRKGRKRTVSWRNTLVYDRKNRITGILSSGIDITDKQLAEENFRLLVESSPYGMIITDDKGLITSVNREIENLFGYSRAELTGKRIELLIPERYRNNHLNFRSAFMKDPENRPMGVGRDLFALKKDGTELPVEVGLSIIKGSEGVSVLATLTDITKRKNAENKLVESNKALEGIINNSPDAVIVYGEDGEILRTNGEFNKLFNKSAEQFINNVWQIIPNDYKVKFAELLRNAEKGKKITDYEMEKTLADGKRISVGIGLVHIDGEDGMFIETIRDITERVTLRNRILEFEKAQIVSKMAEGIAHHMGTPLASMLLRVQILKEDITADLPDNSMVKKLDSVEKNIMYGQKIMQKLLRFASSPSSEKTRVDISNLLENASEIIRPLCLKSGINLELNTEPLFVDGDPDMLELVISDLMMNSIDAMPNGGELRVKTENVTDKILDVRIVISDTGTGIPEDVLPFVFEPFFSSKPSGKGTGLGLAVAKRIIKDHRGEINIRTAIGKGTAIGIELPSYAEDKT